MEVFRRGELALTVALLLNAANFFYAYRVFKKLEGQINKTNDNVAIITKDLGGYWDAVQKLEKNFNNLKQDFGRQGKNLRAQKDDIEVIQDILEGLADDSGVEPSSIPAPPPREREEPRGKRRDSGRHDRDRRSTREAAYSSGSDSDRDDDLDDDYMNEVAAHLETPKNTRSRNNESRDRRRR